MPRNGWQKPESDQRLSDHLTIAMLTRLYPASMVDAAIAATGRAQQRQRLLPARVVLYHLMAMGLFTEASYEEVMRRLLEGLAWQQRWATSWQVPTKAAIFKARTRLGIEPLAELYRRAVHPLTDPSTPGAYYRGLPVVTIDRLDLSSGGTIHTESQTARPTPDPSSTLPITGLVEAASHAVLTIVLDDTDVAWTGGIADKLQSDTLYLLDDQTGSHELLSAIIGHGSDLLWASDHIPELTNPSTRRELTDGSILVHLTDPDHEETSPKTIRVLEPPLAHAPDVAAGSTDPTGPVEQPAGASSECRLLTTLLDPVTAPAQELRDLYTGRATILNALEDLRVHQRSPTLVPHSQSVDGISQELYGLLLAHYAIQSLLSNPAKEDEPPSQVGTPPLCTPE